MQKSRFTNEQMVGIIRGADREPVAEAVKRHGISEQTIYVWRKRFGELRAGSALTGCRAALVCAQVRGSVRRRTPSQRA